MLFFSAWRVGWLAIRRRSAGETGPAVTVVRSSPLHPRSSSTRACPPAPCCTPHETPRPSPLPSADRCRPHRSKIRCWQQWFCLHFVSGACAPSCQLWRAAALVWPSMPPVVCRIEAHATARTHDSGRGLWRCPLSSNLLPSHGQARYIHKGLHSPCCAFPVAFAACIFHQPSRSEIIFLSVCRLACARPSPRALHYPHSAKLVIHCPSLSGIPYLAEKKKNSVLPCQGASFIHLYHL